MSGRFLSMERPPSVLVPAMLNYGQLARLSRDNYPVLAEVCACAAQQSVLSVMLIGTSLPISDRGATSVHAPGVQARLVEHMRPLLEHKDGEVRARACNVIGNLCRYNTAFYEAISRAGLIEPLIDRCQDFDRATRKFACFAIGNAGKCLLLAALETTEASFLISA
jgi:fused-like protein